MTLAQAGPGPLPLSRDATETVADALERDFDHRPRSVGTLANQHLLDGLDRGHLDRFTIWPGERPLGVLYAGASGTVALAGVPDAGAALADCAERLGWRVLIGAERVVGPLLDGLPRGLFRRRASVRQQRFMVAVGDTIGDPPHPRGFRRANMGDVGVLTDFACRLHVEDQMGPPVSRSARASVRGRMEQSVSSAATWVVERDGQVVAKVDVSLRSPRRGAQIAGVYVEDAYRGRGIATAAVAALTADLLADGLPGVTLHVRADNAAGITAYQRAGFTDHGPLTLALR